MKKIIEQRRYDTDTAEAVGYYSYSNKMDFHFFEEILYRKRSGEFFLYGSGGPASKYRERESDNMWTGGETIKPLTYEQAGDWAERYLDADDYEKVFGEVSEVSEDDEKITRSFSLPVDVVEKLKRLAARNNRTLSEIVSDLIIKEKI